MKGIGARLFAAAMLFLLTPGAHADEAQLQEIRAAWAGCQDVATKAPEGWIGWKRDFFNGYGDDFNFWNNAGSEPRRPSLLRTTHVIDAIAILTTTYCFRDDDSLAFIFTVMSSPNAAEGPNQNKPVSREGRIYVGHDGAVIKVLGQILDDRKKPHPLDNPDWQLMRGCSTSAFYRTVADVEKAYVAELGDIEGSRPQFQPEELDWCNKAAKP